MSFPPGPDLGELRLANPSDILRIGIVAAVAFRYSPLFRWERLHKDFPADTLLSYRTQFRDATKYEDVIVLVIEHSFIPNEKRLHRGHYSIGKWLETHWPRAEK
ncbi:hypothetical protein BBP40_008475 [Aspergillus hancockii]|nr:hypothetical protein BBP40_008475 [Aspergillus hancockii]